VKRAIARGHDKKTIEEIAAQIRRSPLRVQQVPLRRLLDPVVPDAWFKAYYPAEFMAALLSSEIGNTDRVVQYINEARELDLQVLAPDVNESVIKFTVVSDRRIRFGWGRCATSARGDCVDHRRPARRAVSLARGAVRSHRSAAVQQARDRIADRRRRLRFPRGRSARSWSRPWIMRSAKRRCASRSALPASMPCSARTPRRRTPHRPARRPPLDRARAAGAGKAVLGFFISGHPLAKYRAEVELFGTRTTRRWECGARRRSPSPRSSRCKAANLQEDGRNTRASRSRIFTARRRRWCSPSLGEAERSDPDRWCVFNQRGYIARDQGEEQAPSSSITHAVSTTCAQWSDRRGAALDGGEPPPAGDHARDCRAVCAHPGPTPLFIEWRGERGENGNKERDEHGGTVRLRSRAFRVDAADDLLAALRDLLGAEGVHL